MAIGFVFSFIGFIFGTVTTSLLWYIIISKEDKKNADMAFKNELLKTIREKEF